VGQLAILLGVLVSGCDCGFALNPELDIGQYAHTARTIRDGFFKSPANSITQTPYRYLGLGTEEPHTKTGGGLHAEKRDATGRKCD
jgi:hypothetical protein